MYAVAGRWTLDRSRADRLGDALEGIVAGVRQLPGFVRGVWARDVTDPSADLTWIDDMATLRAAPRPGAVPDRN